MTSPVHIAKSHDARPARAFRLLKNRGPMTPLELQRQMAFHYGVQVTSASTLIADARKYARHVVGGLTVVKRWDSDKGERGAWVYWIERPALERMEP